MNHSVKFYSFFLALALGTAPLCADDAAAPAEPAPAAPAMQEAPQAPQFPRGGDDSNGGESRRGRRRGGFGGFGGGMPPMMNDLKEKYPDEVAEIEKLRETDPEAARTKMRELFSKAGFSRGDRRMGPPGMGFGGELPEDLIAKLKEKCPEEYAEYEKLKESDPEAAHAKLRELFEKAGIGPRHGEEPRETVMVRDRHRKTLEKVREELKTRYPERYAAIENKWKTDPDGARRDFRALFKEANIEIAEGQTSLTYDYAEETNRKNSGSSQGNRGDWGGGPGGPGGFGPPPGGFGPPPGMGGGR